MPFQNDVLAGKGNRVQNHQGNKNYRAIIVKWKPDYAKTKEHTEKDVVAYNVLKELKSLSPPANFLIKLEDHWYPMDEAAIIQKIKQALREKKKAKAKQFYDKVDGRSERKATRVNKRERPKEAKPRQATLKPHPKTSTLADFEKMMDDLHWERTLGLLRNLSTENNKSDKSPRTSRSQEIRTSSDKSKVGKSSTIQNGKKKRCAFRKVSCESNKSDKSKDGERKSGTKIKNGKKKKED